MKQIASYIFFQLTRMRTAVAILIAIALCSLLGSWLPQNLEIHYYRFYYGVFFGTVITSLQFDHLYTAPWFLFLLTLVCLSTTLCIIRTIIKVPFKKKRAATWGYFFTHIAICLIGVGAFFNSDLMPHLTMMLENNKNNDNHLHTLSPSFQGSLLISQKKNASHVQISERHGHFLEQPLPFTVSLKNFEKEYYPDGRVRQYSCQVALINTINGAVIKEHDIKINWPLSWQGIRFYLANVADAGSTLIIHLSPFQKISLPDMIQLQSGQMIQKNSWRIYANSITLEDEIPEQKSEKNTYKDSWFSSLWHRMTQPAATQQSSYFSPSIQLEFDFNNEPTIAYKIYLRQPSTSIETVFEVRNNPNESWKIIRIPTEPDGSIKYFSTFMLALKKSSLREQAAEQYAKTQMPMASRHDRNQLTASAYRLLTQFSTRSATGDIGLVAVSQQLNLHVEPSERTQAQEIFAQVLSGTVLELMKITQANVLLKTTPDLPTYILAANDVLQQNIAFIPMIRYYKFRPNVTLDVRKSYGDPLFITGLFLLLIGIIFLLVPHYKNEK
jgi:cytochrome c biogenesis protein